MSGPAPTDLASLMDQIRDCTLCAESLPLGPRPVLQASGKATILIAGQAPGRRVHETGVPFDDASGERLRDWMGVDCTTFYDPKRIAIVPMGFCYPGTGKSGDLAPKRECAQAWRHRLLQQLPNVRLTLIIGSYAIRWHLPDHAQKSLAETVRASHTLPSGVVALPHPSPRNNIWLKKNIWFGKERIPDLRSRVRAVI